MGTTLSLAIRHEWWGKWWTPDNPNVKYGGLAVFDPTRGISLRLSGGFDHRVFEEPAPGVRSYSGDTRGFPVVFGEVGSALITLVDCVVTSSSGPLFDGERYDQTLASRLLLQGCHLPNADDAKFVAVETTIENLPKWTVESAIGGQVKHPKPGTAEMPSATYEIGHIESHEALFDEKRFVLHYPYGIPRLKATRTRHEALLHDEPSITVEFPQPVSVHQALAPVGQLRDLLTLAMGEPCGTVTQRLFLPPDPDRYPDKHPYSTHRRGIACLTPQFYQARPDSDPVPDRDVLFTLKDVSFSEVVPRWLEVHARFRAASNILLGLLYNSEQYLETRAISAVAAAESFHRALDPAPPIPDDVFDELRRTLIAATPKQHQSLVRDRFRRNEPSLKERLLGLIGRLDPEVAARIAPNPDAWAKKARDSRNTLAHEGSAEDQDYAELYAVAEVTAAVVMLNLLQELGVPSDKTSSKMEENRVLSRAAELSNEHLQGPRRGDPS